jgi:hypothetical protein
MTLLIVKFIGVAYLQTRGLYSFQLGNISSISDKLENLNSHFLNELEN